MIPRHLSSSLLTILAVGLFSLLASTAAAAQLPGGHGSDPFTQPFRGDEIELRLTRDAEQQLRGELVFRGQRYPVRAWSEGPKLEGSFRANGNEFRFSAEWNGRLLQLSSGGRLYELRATRLGDDRLSSSGAASASTLVMQKREFRDPGFGGIVSHTMLLPEGWRGDAGVRWFPSADNFIHFVGEFAAPEGHGIRYDYSRSYRYSTSPDLQRKHQQELAIARNPTLGIAPPPQRPGQAAQQVLSNMRPGARDIRLVSVKRFEELERLLRERYRPMLQNMAQGTHMGIHCERARVSYELDGQRWEEDIQYVLTICTVQFRGPYLNFDSYYWGVDSVFAARAPLGQLDARLPELNAVATTLKPTPRWSISVTDLRMQISRIKHQGRMDQIRSMGDTARKIANINSQISDQRMASWRKQQDSSHRIQRKVVNSIHGVHDYRTSDGRNLSFDHNYRNVFEDPAGNLVMSTDPSFDPRQDPNLGTRTWKPVRRVQ
jgi:hypothetical protein